MSQAYSQTSNLYSEDDLLRNAAEKNFRAKGFDRKVYNKIFNEKAGSNFSDSAIGHALPAGYFNLDDSFSGGGAMPPPGGNYFQTGQAGQPNQPGQQVHEGFIGSMFKGLGNQAIAAVKDSIYRNVTEWPILLRNFAAREIDKLGPVPDLLSSLFYMGWDCGPLQRTIGRDLLYDKLEFIIGDTYKNGIYQRRELFGIRLYNERPETEFIKYLRKDSPNVKAGKETIVPNKGRPVNGLSDLVISPDGLISGYKTELCGGYPLRAEQIGYDDFYTKSHTLSWATHKESDTPELSKDKLQDGLVTFATDHYIFDADVQEDEIGTYSLEDGTVIKYSRRILPSLRRFDGLLFQKTLTRVLAAALITHIPYKLFEKIYERFGLKEFENEVEQRELDNIFFPLRRYVARVGYG